MQQHTIHKCSDTHNTNMHTTPVTVHCLLSILVTCGALTLPLLIRSCRETGRFRQVAALHVQLPLYLCIALLGVYIALLGVYIALLGVYIALLGVYTALLGVYIALLGVYVALL